MHIHEAESDACIPTPIAFLSLVSTHPPARRRRHSIPLRITRSESLNPYRPKGRPKPPGSDLKTCTGAGRGGALSFTTRGEHKDGIYAPARAPAAGGPPLRTIDKNTAANRPLTP
ncbi:hypothetical protein SKAU_G00298290 [Synaphobranchus kaupii]|uniref:Uncharacterized protein n=1 Tax=Synaphobranchus kaupii TaxID=118154 RepID=A0A9Q1EV40_SYNKA|nr:hypothetical protein SKAU_G00298290 [Synaphobranchus kaupii]